MFLPYGHQSISDEDIAAVSKALKGDLITRGSATESFEKAVATYVGAEYAVAFSSGSVALAGAYFAKEITRNDHVLTSPNTFIATSAFASRRGARTSFLDIDRKSGNLNLDLIEPHLNFESTRGRLFIVPVHFAGISVDMERLYHLAKKENIVVIEDGAHALGSFDPEGNRVGSCKYSDMTIFSFHPVKTITTGEGGMVTTNDPDLYERLKRFRNNGIVKGENPWQNEVVEFSSNFHMTEFQAALGLSQLGRIEAFISKRRALVKRYREKLASFHGIELFDPSFDDRTAYHLMVAQIDFKRFGVLRGQVMELLKQEEVGTQLHYIPLYRHPCYKAILGEIEESFPEMEIYFERALSLPLFFDMQLDDVDRVAAALAKVLRIR